jgi:polyketide cyclase/dehydrase/lipid transport protein
MTDRVFSFEINRTSTAAPEVLFRLETDARHWPEWGTPLILQAGWDRWASPPGAVGAIRRVGTWPVLMFEETLEYEENRRHVYTFARRAPVNGYRGEVLFEPNPSGGTDLCWRGSFTERLPGSGPVIIAALRGVMGFLSARLVHAAETARS